MPDAILPPTRPELTRAQAESWIAAHGLTERFVILGRRGYYRDTMGVPGQNDRGIYDDAIVLVSPSRYATFNANTDPSTHGGRLAVLQPGVWPYKLGTHHPGTPGAYECLVQAGPVTVLRDNGIKETGEFYIHIHRGGVHLTSSEGCQTIHPAQWPEFITAAKAGFAETGQTHAPYVLLQREDA